MNAPHHELELENYIAEKLRAQGWLEGKSSQYDKERALFPEDVISWVQDTQAMAWEKLTGHHGASAGETLLNRLAKVLDQKGTDQVLRGGFAIPGAGQIDMSEAAPEDERNEEVLRRYRANRLRFVRQLRYCPVNDWEIDLVFFINGLPVATVELKTDFTQSVFEAMDQYRKDRLPVDPKSKRKHPLLTFRRGAIVHFAMSDSDIRMATKLDGENTVFLPFNQGKGGGAGNPAREDGEYPVAYFWEKVLQKDNWLRIFHGFVYVEKKDKVDAQGNIRKSETLIFPRFHQWRAVTRMIADAIENGPGYQYLCEHSAGSGKTSTISWTAHDLVRLRRPDGTAVFDTVIIVTDRTVLDAQLREAVQQIDHQFGVIAAIDREKTSKSKSQQLKDAMMAGTPIIVVTIQTFPWAMEAILTEQSLSNKNFAVIIDEAHTSQTGSNATKLRAALSLDSKADLAHMTIEELLEQLQKSRVRPKNVSHFAFTATPKHSTMMLFGRPKNPDLPLCDKTNPPVPFDLYSMRQAIEEEFILDVLKNYLPYKTAVKLGQTIKDDKRVDKKQARRALSQWLTLHPTMVAQKVEFIVEHFSSTVANLLNGEAKAMVVTSSRAAAVKYKLAFDDYIQKHPKHAGIRALVAFSGKITGKEINHSHDELIQDDPLRVSEDEEFTEASMNPGSGDLRVTFDRPEYRVMLVANKFQTGFDQPRLVAMYLDKKISGVDAVQTLSRLNRTYPGKDETYVIDFVNDPAVIRQAFADYYDGAHIEDIQNPDVAYDIKDALDKAGIYTEHDIEQFKQACFKTLRNLGDSSVTHKSLYAATQRPTDVFNSKLAMLRGVLEQLEAAYQRAAALGDTQGMKTAEHHRSEHTKERERLLIFKNQLARFCRVYSYVAQLIDFGDPDLENFAAFAKMLHKRLDGVTPDQVDVRGLVLNWMAIKPQSTGGDAEPEPLKPLGPGGGEGQDREKAFLSEIIERLNRIFGDMVPIEDQRHFTAQVAEKTALNDAVMAQIALNTKDQALHGDLPRVVAQAVITAMMSNEKMAKLLLKDGEHAMKDFTGLIYDVLKQGPARDILGDA